MTKTMGGDPLANAQIGTVYRYYKPHRDGEVTGKMLSLTAEELTKRVKK
ncbi:hypothetical protein [Catalinimonas alkaloidigena]|nr:hypothetical protein [Catalinimonas alkaloidigena]